MRFLTLLFIIILVGCEHPVTAPSTENPNNSRTLFRSQYIVCETNSEPDGSLNYVLFDKINNVDVFGLNCFDDYNAVCFISSISGTIGRHPAQTPVVGATMYSDALSRWTVEAPPNTFLPNIQVRLVFLY